MVPRYTAMATLDCAVAGGHIANGTVCIPIEINPDIAAAAITSDRDGRNRAA